MALQSAANSRDPRIRARGFIFVMTCVDFELIVTWSSVIQPVKRPEMEEVDNNGSYRQFGFLDYVFD